MNVWHCKCTLQSEEQNTLLPLHWGQEETHLGRAGVWDPGRVLKNTCNCAREDLPPVTHFIAHYKRDMRLTHAIIPFFSIKHSCFWIEETF
jgi:hypothetical protein